jgi:hypothetical protein
MHHTWRSLNAVLTQLSEDEVLDLLNEEKQNGKRQMVLTRLHQRYSMLRAARERKELFLVVHAS